MKIFDAFIDFSEEEKVKIDGNGKKRRKRQKKFGIVPITTIG